MSKPKMNRADLLKMLAHFHPDYQLPELAVIGVRGYFLNTMGADGKNDRNIFDDAIFIVGKDKKEFFAFSGNTDPSRVAKHMANLVPGIFPVYKFDLHRGQYLALCQRGGKVTVNRDLVGLDTGNFGINIHKGGNWSTGSLGCQTIPRDQWDEFISKAVELAKKYYGKGYYAKSDYPYILLDNEQYQK